MTSDHHYILSLLHLCEQSITLAHECSARDGILSTDSEILEALDVQLAKHWDQFKEHWATADKQQVVVEITKGVAEVTQCPLNTSVKIIDHDSLDNAD